MPANSAAFPRRHVEDPMARRRTLTQQQSESREAAKQAAREKAEAAAQQAAESTGPTVVNATVTAATPLAAASMAAAGDSEAGEPSRSRGLTDNEQQMANDLAAMTGRGVPTGRTHLEPVTAERSSGSSTEPDNSLDVFDSQDDESDPFGGLPTQSASGIPMYGTSGKGQMADGLLRPGMSSSSDTDGRHGYEHLKPADDMDNTVSVVTGWTGFVAAAAEGTVAVGAASTAAVTGGVAGAFGLGWTLGRMADEKYKIGERVTDAATGVESDEETARKAAEARAAGEARKAAKQKAEEEAKKEAEAGAEAETGDSAKASGDDDGDAGSAEASNDSDAGSGDEVAGTPDATQPPDGESVSLAQALAWRQYLNSMTGYEQAKAAARNGDIDPDDNPAREYVDPSALHRDDGKGLKGDHFGEFGGIQPIPDGALGPAGNVHGNVDPSDETLQNGGPGPWQDVQTDRGRVVLADPLGSDESESSSGVRWTADDSDDDYVQVAGESTNREADD